ncbi:MAG: gluconate 2-dehydrogenase subunit 3 family protein [Burkholderiaceae bacterium]
MNAPDRADATSTLAPTLRAYVDTLIPADETPPGSALGVDRALLAKGVRRDYARLLELGLAWIDRAALAAHGQRFHLLGEAARDAIVGRAAAADAGSLPRVFFVRTRADAFHHYYGQPASWRDLGAYAGPPQPRGFPDFAAPARAKR